MPDASLPWLSLVALGAAHGINPAMGWLFAVGRGMQERDRRAVWRAFGPLAAGHALAVCVAVLLAITAGQVLPVGWLRWVIGAALLTLGLDSLVRHRHVRLRGMRVTPLELAGWSFLTASAHGAGLMVLPFIAGAVAPATAGAPHHQHAESLVAGAAGLPVAAGVTSMSVLAVTAPLIHTFGYVVMTVLLAVVVYEKVGVRILRRAWINLNVFWSAALIVAAVMAVVA